MAIGIDEKSTRIHVNDDEVWPDVKIVKGPPVRGTTSFFPGGAASVFLKNGSPKAKEALNVDGHVQFVLGTGDTLKGWTVGFIQIVRMTEFITRYSGRIDSEGSVVCDAMAALSSKLALDCSIPAAIPWMHIPEHKEIKGSVATPTTTDTPNQNVPLALTNGAASNVPNLLYDFKQECEFWTILAAMSPAKALQYLAYFRWRFRHKVSVVWRAGVPVPSDWGTFEVTEKFVAGAPADPDLQPILKSPTGPIANVAFKKAILDSFISNNALIHSESAKGLSPMVLDFWEGLPPNVA